MSLRKSNPSLALLLCLLALNLSCSSAHDKGAGKEQEPTAPPAPGPQTAPAQEEKATTAVATGATSELAADDPRRKRRSSLADAAYAGSTTCAKCHPNVAAEWQKSAHAGTVIPATFEDEERIESLIDCSGMPISHTLGDRHQVRYLIEDPSVPWGEGRWLALPCAWDLGLDEVSVIHEDDWRELPWESGCAACHTTDFRAKDHGFRELGIGCEECHGPSGPHVDSMEESQTLGLGSSTPAEELTICASCHLQDGRSLGSRLKFPDNYIAGGSLFDDYEYDWALLDEASDKVLDVHQKRLIRSVIFGGEDNLRCSSCHSVHGLGHEKHQDLPKQDYCLLCHETDFSVKEYSTSCNVCEF